MPVRELGDYVARQVTTPLSEASEHHAKRAVIDWFAAMLPGAVMDPCPLLREAFVEEIGAGRSTLYPTGERATARAAAFLNGAAAHTAEFDDIHRDSAVHPSCATVAAALALGQREGVDGAHFLRAVVAGIEVACRIGLAMGREHYRLWHATATMATFGATAASAAVLRLDGTRTAHAIANAATLAAGLQQAFRGDGMAKPLHAAHAAEVGLTTALAAARGVTGALDVLDGPVGMGVAMSGAADWSRATEGLGTRFLTEEMTFKNHGCCGHTFAAIDGALAIAEAHGLSADDVARVEVGSYRPAVEICGRDDPQTPQEAKFSLPYVVATALVHGGVRLAAFEPARLTDPKVRTLMPKISYALDEALDAKFPGQRAARVTIHTHDGRRLEHLQPTRKGDPDMPLSDGELSDKFTELAGSVLPADASDALLAALWGLEGRRSLDLPASAPQRLTA